MEENIEKYFKIRVALQNKFYVSPRWSSEVLDCAMPMSFDTYSVCAFNCLYCFAFFQKSHSLDGYLEKIARPVNVKAVEKIFIDALYPQNHLLKRNQFKPYIQAGYPLNWGGLADGFDYFEERFGKSLELLRFFDKIDYPLSISTKGVFWTKDRRYMDLFKKHTHNWHVKISIITTDEDKARRLELGVPSPSERFEALKRLSDIGIYTTLRYRPFIPTVSDNFQEAFDRAKAAGVKSVTTEFLCIEKRANAQLKKRYKLISEVVGFDIFQYYKQNSESSGLMRLRRHLKVPWFKAMRDYAHKLGLAFYVSDIAGREYSDGPNCCGAPPKYQKQCVRGTYMGALQIAKERGEVHFADIKDEVYRLFGGFSYTLAQGFNEGGSHAKSKFVNKSLADWIHHQWNNYKSVQSPSGYKVLIPSGIDKNGDVVYKYIGEGSDGSV